MSTLEAKFSKLSSRAKSLQALESAQFRLYITGQSVSAMGTGLQQVALSWYVYRITHSVWALAALTAMLLAGQALFSFAGGCLADKYDRQKLLIALQWSGAILAVILAFAVALQCMSLPVILLLALVLGCFAALEYPARQSLNTELVKREQLLSARGLYSCICAISIALGQASAGLFIDRLPAFGEATCALLNAASFLFSLLTLQALKKERVKPVKQQIDGGDEKSFEPKLSYSNGLYSNQNIQEDAAVRCASADELRTNSTGTSSAETSSAGTGSAGTSNDQQRQIRNKDCIKYVFNSEIILASFIQTIVLVLFGLRYVSLLPAFASEVLHGGAKESGMLTATVALGFSAGALICGGLKSREKLELWADFSLLLLPLGLLSLCLSSSLQLALLSVLFAAVCQSTSINAGICLMQLCAPNRLFGRLMGLRVTIIAACDLLAALFMAMIVQHYGLRMTIMSAAFICFLCAMLLFSRRAFASQSGSMELATIQVEEKL